MLKNFQLAAVVKQDSQMRLLRVPLLSAVQKSLAESWQDQYDMFVGGAQEIDFNFGYKPDAHENFCIHGYEPPDWFAGTDSQTIRDLASIGKDQASVDSIQGIVSFARDRRNEELVLFQNFTRSQVIRPGWFLLLEHNTYKSPEYPGLALDRKLSAVYQPVEQKLLFHNFRTVNTFLPLDDYYEEASTEEIKEVLNHDRLAPEDIEVSSSSANKWFRTRFAMLKESGVLDKFSVEEILSCSQGYDVQIHTRDGKIIFPVDNTAAKKLLQFLNEERFLGAITDTLYETNSKRKAD